MEWFILIAFKLHGVMLNLDRTALTGSMEPPLQHASDAEANCSCRLCTVKGPYGEIICLKIIYTKRSYAAQEGG